MVVLAHEEARLLRHNYIGTEHLLLGLLREEEGLAARVLESLDITVEHVRANVVRIVAAGEEATSGQIPFTPRAKKVLEHALTEALGLGHNYIGTEHLLLGLLRENDGVGVRILRDFDADAEKVRTELLRMLSGPQARSEARPRAVSDRGNQYSLDQAWFGGLGGVLNGLAREILRELERTPDTGDLLLALACATDTLAAQTLRELGVDPDRLPGVIKRLRTRRAPFDQELAERIEEVRQAKELAIESREFETAARLRDQERELTQQARADAVVASEVLQQIRRQLGIPRHPDNPSQPPDHS